MDEAAVEPVQPGDDARDGGHSVDRRSRRKQLWRTLALAALLVVLGPVGAGFLVAGYGATTYHWRGFDVQVSLAPSLKGETRLVFAPLGEVRAKTHETPVALDIALRGISFEDLKRMIASPPKRDELERDFRATARECLTDFALRQIVLGGLGGLIFPLLLRLKRLWGWLLCVASGAGFVALVFLHATHTFDRQAFDNPTYTGSLREANWIIGLVKEGFTKANTLSERLRGVADNLNVLYGRIDEIPGFAADVDTIKVLHISDIHNNPAAIDFVRELASKGRIDLVIDTGDLTDLGLPVETHLSRGLAAIQAPYLFVAGNHDSEATVAAVRLNANAHILHDAPVKVAGLEVLGMPDPSSARPGQGSVDTPEPAIQAAGAQLATFFDHAPEPPDIVCVHNPRQAEAVIGKAKLVLCGHMHRAGIEVRNGTVICNAGTTGAAGVRYFQEKEGVPFTAAILAFAKSPKPRLLFIDQVSLSGTLGEYSITRRSFTRAPAPVAPTP